MFDAEADIDIDYFDGDRLIGELGPETRSLTVRTRGLATRGLPELELVQVPPSLNGEAALLLDTASDAAMQGHVFEDGLVWTSPLPDGFSVAARIVVTPRGALRLVDPRGPADSAARMAICAVAVSRSRLIRQPTEEDQAEPELADAILEHALAWYPGEPDGALAPANATLCNEGNCLAYLERSDHLGDPTLQSAAYANALERSPRLRLAEIDGPLPPPVPLRDLASEAAATVRALHDTPRPNDEGDAATGVGGMAFLTSPVLRLDRDGLHQPLAIGPAAFRSYFFEGPVAQRLGSPELHELAARIYQRAVAHPIEALVLARDTARGVYESGYHFNDRPPSRPFAFESTRSTLDHVPFLTRILAALGREIAAGLSLDECRARWRVVDAPSVAAIAETKLRAHRAREDNLYYAAYGL